MTFVDGMTKAIAPVKVSRVTRAIFIVRLVGKATSSLYKLSLEQGRGPYRSVIASSALEEVEFSSVAAGLRIEDRNVSAALHGPGTDGPWLVLERPAQGSNEDGRSETFRVEVLTEEQLEVGPWSEIEE